MLYFLYFDQSTQAYKQFCETHMHVYAIGRF